MVPDIDIWRGANLYAKRHGADAEVQAAMQADRLLEAGDLDGAAVWRSLARAGAAFAGRTVRRCPPTADYRCIQVVRANVG